MYLIDICRIYEIVRMRILNDMNYSILLLFKIVKVCSIVEENEVLFLF